MPPAPTARSGVMKPVPACAGHARQWRIPGISGMTAARVMPESAFCEGGIRKARSGNGNCGENDGGCCCRPAENHQSAVLPMRPEDRQATLSGTRTAAPRVPGRQCRMWQILSRAHPHFWSARQSAALREQDAKPIRMARQPGKGVCFPYRETASLCVAFPGKLIACAAAAFLSLPEDAEFHQFPDVAQRGILRTFRKFCIFAAGQPALETVQ